MVVMKRFLSAFLAAAILFTGSVHTVQAAMISAEQVAASVNTASDEMGRERLMQSLSRADVQAALVARGIDVDAAQARVASLTDDEAGRLASQIDEAPAGGIIGAIVLIFLVLLLTDILGFTKIFPFTRSVR